MRTITARAGGDNKLVRRNDLDPALIGPQPSWAAVLAIVENVRRRPVAGRVDGVAWGQ